MFCLWFACALSAHFLCFAYALAVRYLQSTHTIGYDSLPLGLSEVSDLVSDPATPAPTDGLRLHGLVTTY